MLGGVDGGVLGGVDGGVLGGVNGGVLGGVLGGPEGVPGKPGVVIPPVKGGVKIGGPPTPGYSGGNPSVGGGGGASFIATSSVGIVGNRSTVSFKGLG
ncbi:MAG: hypothetical protein ABI209_06490 [Edaphobacter sp.]